MGDLVPWLPKGSSNHFLVVGAYPTPCCSDVDNEGSCRLPHKACVLFVMRFKLLGIDPPNNTLNEEMVHGFLCVEILNYFLLLLLFYHSFIHQGVLGDSWVY